ncbi:GAF domain-containing protein [Ktedonobacter robiniae]|uniref:GAF domain-containing protein n=1 Tax=Ktedonobacter robiniae TaxID=2778365 RepID=A0ABQ3UIJ8_9CHLR|nr:GAF domain-containing protein [Ktedonobacter robiniae]GHO52534.1 hypothetical protein KSB_10090 [Ktedonobacter robiniae]
MEKYTSWRELLGSIIQDMQERQRIAGLLGVNVVTLGRWAGNASNPRYQHLRRLLSVLPQYRAELQELIVVEFPDFSLGLELSKQGEEQDLISSALYAQVFNIYTIMPYIQRSWSITNLILRHALDQLDSQKQGMAVILIQCMPPSQNGKVCSLRERIGFGNSPWPANLEPHAIFLGMESLSGYVVGTCQSSVLQNRSKEQQGVRPVHWDQLEKSAAAYPIYRESKVAGCFLVSSAVPNYFLPSRLKLIEQYAELLSLVFDYEEFYPLEQISLQIMPHSSDQEKVLFNFRQRVAEVMLTSMRSGENLDIRKAEALVWSQLEQELFALAVDLNMMQDGYHPLQVE